MSSLFFTFNAQFFTIKCIQLPYTLHSQRFPAIARMLHGETVRWVIGSFPATRIAVPPKNQLEMGQQLFPAFENRLAHGACANLM